MKKLISCFLFLFSFTFFGTAQIGDPENDEVEFVDNLCFTITSREHIRVGYEVNTNTLTTIDKLKFINKEVTQNTHEYISNGSVTKDLHFVSHTNMYPKWYNRAYLIRTNTEGVFSYFNEDNQHYKGGWTGGLIQDNELGEYIKDPRTNETYMRTSVKSSEFDTYQENAKINGFLGNYVFYVPSQQEIQILESQGYEVDYESTTIVIKKNDISIVWDLEEHTQTYQVFSDNILIYTKVIYYSYNTVFQEYMTSKKIIATPSTFNNGDCYTHIKETVYSNYSTECNAYSRNSTESTNDEKEIIHVYPNPANEMVNIDTENFKSGKVIISNLKGETVTLRTINPKNPIMVVNTQTWKSGIYLVTIVEGNKKYSSKFIKQ